MFSSLLQASWRSPVEHIRNNTKWQFSVKAEAQLVCVTSVLSSQAVAVCMAQTWELFLTAQSSGPGGEWGVPQAQAGEGNKAALEERCEGDGGMAQETSLVWRGCDAWAPLWLRWGHISATRKSPPAPLLLAQRWQLGTHRRVPKSSLLSSWQSASRDSPRSTHLPDSLVALPACVRVTTCSPICIPGGWRHFASACHQTCTPELWQGKTQVCCGICCPHVAWGSQEIGWGATK